MAGKIFLEVVTPERSIVKEDALTVIAPGILGEFGILIGHTPFMTTLKTGLVRYEDTTGNEKCLFISGGFAEALPDKVTILAEISEKKSEIDIERAKSALQRAQKRLETKDDPKINMARARAALERALHRIKAVETH